MGRFCLVVAATLCTIGVNWVTVLYCRQLLQENFLGSMIVLILPSVRLLRYKGIILFLVHSIVCVVLTLLRALGKAIIFMCILLWHDSYWVAGSAYYCAIY